MAEQEAQAMEEAAVLEQLLPKSKNRMGSSPRL